MLAVIELGWNQFIVKKGDIIDVKKQTGELNTTFSLEAMLLSDDDGKGIKIWTPIVKDSKVELKIIEQYKWEKIRVFKMKSKKRYSKNTGFRPHLTKMEVLSVA